MKATFSILFLFYAFISSAQLTDDFGDGDFTKNPTWQGDTGSYKVNAGRQLQLNLPGAGAAYLFTENKLLKNASWEFYVKLSFAPSSSNFARIYLVSDNSDFGNSLNGYYIQLGENGSLDGVDLFRQDSLSYTKIIDGVSGHVANTVNTLRIKVERDSTAKWTIYSDILGGTDFQLEGTAIDSTYNTTGYFGIFAKVTSTNASKVYWDDFKISSYVKDTLAPKPLKVEILSKNSIELDFSEALNAKSAGDSIHYTLYPDNISPQSAIPYPGEATKVVLTFAGNFIPKQKYEIECKGIKDVAGNIMPVPLKLPFTYFVPVKGDIVFNEIFPDPGPPVGLPEEEFVEIYNNTPYPVPLKGWSISDGTTTATLPDDTLRGNEYAILCASANANLYKAYGKVIPLSSLPSLNNTGDHISLRDNIGLLMDELNYSIDWYKDNVKSDGGWTLERINPMDTCHDFENWTASSDVEGGTPGRKNSVFSNIRDSLPPRLLNIVAIDSQQLLLRFDEKLDSSSVFAASCKLDNIQQPDEIKLQNGRREVLVHFTQVFKSGQKESLHISGLRDCISNVSQDSNYTFIYYKAEKADHFDVLISEIMADPDPTVGLPNAEYIELYNRSSKPIQLKNWRLGYESSFSLLPEYILPPDSYVIICSKSNVALFGPYGSVIGISFPSLSNDGGNLYLISSEGKSIDEVSYSRDWYKDPLKQDGGWSLEMIDPGYPCEDLANWAASKDKLGGTPGKTNSWWGQKINFSNLEATKVIVTDSTHIRILFNMTADSSSLADISNYTISEGFGHPLAAVPQVPAFNRVDLTLGQPLKERIIYSIKAENISSCSGEIKENLLRFGLPEQPDSLDIVINEILFNPNPGGVDFVEVYNRSPKIIDLKGMYLASLNDSGKVIDYTSITGDGYLLLPGDYAVFTSDPAMIESQYQVSSPAKMIKLTSLPSYNDDEGHVAVLRKDGLLLDAVHYNQNWQFPLLNTQDGVSLEKINPNLPSQQQSSWHSAASTAGYATPTYLNSQYSSLSKEKASGKVSLESAVFSPDNDGYQDVLNIDYEFEKAGTVATADVYDVNGRLVRHILRNELLAQTGHLQWDGLSENGQKAPLGQYIILFSSFNPDGATQNEKLVCTLAGKFN